METNLLKLTVLALMPAALLALTSCSSDSGVKSTRKVATEKGVPGGTIVETHSITAKVIAIDAANRRVTLLTPDDKKTTVKAGPEVVNFNQIQVGDHLKILVAEQLVVFARKSGEPQVDGETAAIALAPVGAKPGVMMASTVEVTAKVEAIDLEHRKATTRFPDGTTKTFKVRKDVDLTKRKLGDEVVFRATEALAISVEKP